jgi:hypothetical protein
MTASRQLIRAVMKRRISLAKVRRFKPFDNCFHSRTSSSNSNVKQFKSRLDRRVATNYRRSREQTAKAEDPTLAEWEVKEYQPTK